MVDVVMKLSRLLTTKRLFRKKIEWKRQNRIYRQTSVFDLVWSCMIPTSRPYVSFKRELIWLYITGYVSYRLILVRFLLTSYSQNLMQSWKKRTHTILYDLATRSYKKISQTWDLIMSCAVWLLVFRSGYLCYMLKYIFLETYYIRANEFSVYTEQFPGVPDKKNHYYCRDLLHNGIGFQSNVIISIPR